MNGRRCEVLRLGLIEYQQAWELQVSLAEQIGRGERPPILLLLEHPHTYTFGRRGQAENLLWDEAELSRKGINVHWVDRGGDVTYHGPGQLVGYPILPLAQVKVNTFPSNNKPGARLPQVDYIGYLRNLEAMLILAMLKLGIASGQIEDLTGVWVQPDVLSRCRHCPPALRQRPAKIASIGVKVDARGVSRHGFALNVDPDMSYWEGIVGCGLEDRPTVSLAHLLPSAPPMAQVMHQVVQAFAQVFGYQMVETDLVTMPNS